MKQVLLSFLIYLLLTGISYADNGDDWCLWAKNYGTYSKECNKKEDFKLYKCRVENLCTPCITKDAKTIFKTEPYKEAKEYVWSTRLLSSNILDPFKKVQKIYKTNMNSIYKCVLLDIQERWLGFLEQVISASDPTNLIGKELNTKISSEKIKVKTKKKALKCLWKWEDKSKEQLVKKEVLNQVSLEFCTYSYYLLYLKEYYTNTKPVLWLPDEDTSSSSDNEKMEINDVTNNSTFLIDSIDDELIRINKVFPLAYYAYSEYEDNYVLHLLLTLIKQDYVLVREQLAKVLWPINQLAYKIKDAMKSH